VRTPAISAAALALVIATTRTARADDEVTPPNTHFRFGLMASPTFVTMKVYDVPVHWIDLPIGIGAIVDDGNVGFEWYGTFSWAHGWTRAGRGADSWSVLGSRLIFRLEMVRAIAGFRVLPIFFDPAQGLVAGEGLSGTSALGELGLGIDILRVLAARPDRVRNTITLDGYTQWYSGLGSGVSFAIAIGAHL
jgi:hypothetical protein